MNAREYYRAICGQRKAWAKSMLQRCMACHQKPQWPPLQIHEMCRRSAAPKRWGHPCNYLLLCERCHAGPFATMPHAKQLAYKLREDPENFHLREFIAILTWPSLHEGRVTKDEIASFREELQISQSLLHRLEDTQVLRQSNTGNTPESA